MIHTGLGMSPELVTDTFLPKESEVILGVFETDKEYNNKIGKVIGHDDQKNYYVHIYSDGEVVKVPAAKVSLLERRIKEILERDVAKYRSTLVENPQHIDVMEFLVNIIRERLEGNKKELVQIHNALAQGTFNPEEFMESLLAEESDVPPPPEPQQSPPPVSVPEAEDALAEESYVPPPPEPQQSPPPVSGSGSSLFSRVSEGLIRLLGIPSDEDQAAAAAAVEAYNDNPRAYGKRNILI